MSQRRAWIRTGGAAVLATTLLLAGCSSSTKSSSSSSSAGASTAASPAASTDPITIGFIGSLQSATYNFPETTDAVAARISAVNDAGGVNGRKLKLSSCNDKTDPNQASVCVRQMSTDGAVGVIGGISTVGDAITSGLETAHLVYTGERALSPGELNSSISFPMVGGSSSTAAGLGEYAFDTAGCKKPYVITSDSAPSRLTGTSFITGFKYASKGTTAGQTITPSPNTDYSAAVASASSAKADCVFVSTDVAEGPKVIPVIRTSLPNAKVFETAGAVPPTIIKALGKNAEGLLVADSVLPVNSTGNATLDQFKAEMTKYEPKSAVDAFALTSWLGAQLLINTITKMTGTIDAASVLAAFNKLGNISGQGVIGDFSFQSVSPVASAKRQFNRTYIVFTVKDGAFSATDAKFADATDALKS